MKEHSKHFYCPIWLAGLLDSKLRKYFHNPNKILMIVEPKDHIFHFRDSTVSKVGFEKMVKKIKESGFVEYSKLKIAFSRGIVLKKA